MSYIVKRQAFAIVYFMFKIVLRWELKQKNKQKVRCGRSWFLTCMKYFLFRPLLTDSRAKWYWVGYYPHAVTATIIYGGGEKKRSRDLFGPFFYSYFRKQMSRETSTNASASICTNHIFRRVTNRFCYFPLLSLSSSPSLSLFFFCNTSYYVLVQWVRARERERVREEKRDRNSEEGSEILLVHAVPTNELTDNGGPRWKNKGKRDVERRAGALITKGAPGVFVDKGAYMQMAVRRRARRKEKVSLSRLLPHPVSFSLFLSVSMPLLSVQE